MRILVLGPIDDKLVVRKENYDLVIAVDMGLKNALKRDIKVDVAIGDFDSLEDNGLLDKIETVIKFNEEKDDSDFECALKYIDSFYKNSEVEVLGFLYGNRLDHLLNNILLLYKYSNLKIRFISEKTNLYLLNKGEHKLVKNKFKYISFFALKKAIVQLKNGFKYKVNNECIDIDSTKFISNEIVEEIAYLNVDNNLIVMECND